LFTYALNERTNSYEIQSRGFLQVKEKLLQSLTNMGHPEMTVVDANYENRGELYLKHRFDGIELRKDYAQATMENIQKIWMRPVNVQTVCGESITLLTYDGTNHRERTLTEASAV